MKKLLLGLALAITAAAEAEVIIDGLKYELDTQNKSATITDCEVFPTTIDIGVVEYEGQKYTVTSVGKAAFENCTSLTSVSLPNVTTIGESAFSGCKHCPWFSLPNATTIGKRAFFKCPLISVDLPNATTIGDEVFVDCDSLTSVSLPNATTIGEMSFVNCIKLDTVILGFGPLANPDRQSWALRDEAKLVEPFTVDQIQNAAYKVAVVTGVRLIDKGNYEKGCAYYSLAPKAEPQVVQEGEIVVQKTELRAAKAEAVTVEKGIVMLGVNVCSNGNFTAETKTWAPVEIKSENVEVKDGKIVISIPVTDKSGFMILQSGDAKIAPAE